MDYSLTFVRKLILLKQQLLFPKIERQSEALYNYEDNKKHKKRGLNSYLNIIVEDEMSVAVFCKQPKGIVISKIFKLCQMEDNNE